MVQLLFSVGNLLWLAVYIMIIRVGLRDRTYGMPLLALCGNLSWEANYAFIRHYNMPLSLTSLIWLLLDCAILYTVVRFGPAQFPWLPRWLFFCGLGVMMAMCCVGMEVLIRYFEAGGREAGGNYSGLTQNLLMSALFLSMLVHRRSTSGQSMAIAVCKALPTVLGAAAVYLWVKDGGVESSPLLIFLGGSTLVLDMSYVAGVWAVRRSTAAVAAGTPVAATA